MQKGDDVYKLDDLPSKQLGFVLSHVSEMLSATEVYECGGELEPWIQSGFGWALDHWGLGHLAELLTKSGYITLKVSLCWPATTKVLVSADK